MDRNVELSEEVWAMLYELNGDPWLCDGHRELVIDTLLRIAIPIAKAKIDNGLPL